MACFTESVGVKNMHVIHPGFTCVLNFSKSYIILNPPWVQLR